MITIHDYYMGIFPVTNAQYKEFIDANEEQRVPSGSKQKWADWDGKKRTFPEGMENHPVVCVSYEDALAYCKWRAKKEGLAEAEGYRLPTEEEWEKAAAWDEEKKKKNKYPWGDAFDQEKCNTRESGKGQTTPAGSYPRGVSPYGCQDMAGNVWEWADSWYDKGGKLKMVRGGSWDCGQVLARCAYRISFNPSLRLNLIGFRVARTKKA
jgi:iron(II)-dependent oxidoreductase